MRGLLFIVAAASVGVVLLLSTGSLRRPSSGDATAEQRVEHGPANADPDDAPATAVAWSTPRPVTVRATWQAASDASAEGYSEGRFASVDLRFGERLYIERVCVSDARKLTMIGYRDAVGHTDVPLPLGARGVGRVDPDNRNCTLFAGVEVAALEKCKCWFQCGGERHECTVNGTARRP